MADEPLFARDVLITDFVVLDAGQTAAHALEALAKAGVKYGIVTNGAGIPLTLTTAGLLAANRDPEIQFESATMMPAFVVDVVVSLDQIVLYSAQSLVECPDMAGLIVENEGKVVGVLPRQTIRHYAQQIKTRGGDITELAGVPQIRAKYFVCPKDKQHYKKLIIRYDPDDPPTCPYHNLVLLEQP